MAAPHLTLFLYSRILRLEKGIICNGLHLVAQQRGYVKYTLKQCEALWNRITWEADAELPIAKSLERIMPKDTQRSCTKVM